MVVFLYGCHLVEEGRVSSLGELKRATCSLVIVPSLIKVECGLASHQVIDEFPHRLEDRPSEIQIAWQTEGLTDLEECFLLQLISTILILKSTSQLSYLIMS